jgi:hypothetical protein
MFWRRGSESGGDPVLDGQGDATTGHEIFQPAVDIFIHEARSLKEKERKDFCVVILLPPFDAWPVPRRLSYSTFMVLR